MKLTLRQNLNLNSMLLRHDINTQSVLLVTGREGALLSELKLYVLLSLIHNLCEEDVITECNEDEHDLITIVRDEIEPFYFKIIEDKPEIGDLYNNCINDIVDYCNKVYSEQHSLLGLLNTLVDVFSRLDDQQVQEVLVKTGEIAGQVKEKRDKLELEQDLKIKEQVVQKQEEISQGIKKMMEQYNTTVKE